MVISAVKNIFVSMNSFVNITFWTFNIFVKNVKIFHMTRWWQKGWKLQYCTLVQMYVTGLNCEENSVADLVHVH